VGHEEPAHLLCALEAPLAVSIGGEADPVDRNAEADRRQDVGQTPAVGVVIPRVSCCQEASPGRGRHTRQRVQPMPVGAVVDDGRRAQKWQDKAIPQRTGVGQQTRGKGGIGKGRGHGRHDPTFSMVEHFCPAELALALRRAHAAEGQEFGQSPIALPARRPDQIGGAVVQLQTRPDDEAKLDVLGGDMRADHPSQAVTIADANTSMTKRGGGRDHFSRVRRALKQREVGACAQLCEGDRHAR
jgi:hypothetical protein